MRVLTGRGGWGPRTSGLRSRPTLGWRPKIIVYLRAVGVGAPSGVFDCRFALAKLGACGPLAQSELCFSFKGRNSRHFLVTSVGAFVVLAGFKEPVSSCESQARSLQPRAHLVFFSFFEGSGAIQLAGRIPCPSSRLAAGEGHRKNLRQTNRLEEQPDASLARMPWFFLGPRADGSKSLRFP